VHDKTKGEAMKEAIEWKRKDGKEEWRSQYNKFGIDKEGDYFKLTEDPNRDYTSYIGEVLTLKDAKHICSLLFDCWVDRHKKQDED
jgi:hypothetical protein